jgi:arylsulfatase A-like enzyme
LTRRDFLKRSAGGAIAASVAGGTVGGSTRAIEALVRRLDRAQGSGPPDIVLIVTDDQRWDTLWAMPTIQSELVAKGVTFSNSFVVNPLCCPGRATLLTGLYSHSTGIYQNDPPIGGFDAFDDGSTVATWLQGAGYRTGLVGKYLNGYTVEDQAYIPPGWDRWVAWSDGGYYYDYTLTVDGTPVTYGENPEDYMADVLAGYADAFIRDTPPGEPLFLYFAPNAPHGPATPPQRYQGAFDDLPPFSFPSSNESDVTDKPAYVRRLPSLTQQRTDELQSFRQDQYRTLLAADDAVATLLTALSDTGRLSNAMIVYLSDNGLLWDEHRLDSLKQLPYEESIRVPMIVRFDPMISTARTDPSLVANIDVAPTFAEVAAANTPHTDGASLLNLLAGVGTTWRTEVLVEHVQDANLDIPTLCMTRSEDHAYVVYATGEEELYDLGADPWQLRNIATTPGSFELLAALREWTAEQATPRPVGFTYPFGSVTAASAGDAGFAPATLSVSLSAVERWTFDGTVDHTVTDSSVLGLFDSGPRAPGAAFDLGLSMAGTFRYACAIHPQHTGAVRVPPVATPSGGPAVTPFVIAWATATPPDEFRFDVLVLRPGAFAPVPWRWGQKVNSSRFTPDVGAGIYRFLARVRRPSDGTSTPWSPPLALTVT